MRLEVGKPYWVISNVVNFTFDGPVLFLYNPTQNLWGPFRDRAYIFDSKFEAEKVLKKCQTKSYILEVEYSPSIPFKVTSWGNPKISEDIKNKE